MVKNSNFLIAEAGINHNGSLKTALKLVDTAKKSGADAIKFQTYITEKRINKKYDKIFRILKKGGSLRILEFSKVNNKAFSKLYDFYSYKIIPTIGELVSDDKKSYEYLVKSIRTHENQKELKSMLKKNKFSKVSFEDLTNGIVCIHSGIK